MVGKPESKTRTRSSTMICTKSTRYFQERRWIGKGAVKVGIMMMSQPLERRLEYESCSPDCNVVLFFW
uniref:Uncharacterized protein n=1 Tax=Medicago truncatula TaxID=3880 RepID=B7FGB5_MEDTR|nr:unknown [Medicago truncatula]